MVLAVIDVGRATLSGSAREMVNFIVWPSPKVPLTGIS